MRIAKLNYYVLLFTVAQNIFAPSTALTQIPNSEDNRNSLNRSAITINSPDTIEAAKHPQMKEDMDGELTPGEFTVISPNGSITRALCPYTCDMRGLPQKFCKSWHSKLDSAQCYLQDTRIPSSAIK